MLCKRKITKSIIKAGKNYFCLEHTVITNHLVLISMAAILSLVMKTLFVNSDRKTTFYL